MSDQDQPRPLWASASLLLLFGSVFSIVTGANTSAWWYDINANCATALPGTSAIMTTAKSDKIALLALIGGCVSLSLLIFYFINSCVREQQDLESEDACPRLYSGRCGAGCSQWIAVLYVLWFTGLFGGAVVSCVAWGMLLEINHSVPDACGTTRRNRYLVAAGALEGVWLFCVLLDGCTTHTVKSILGLGNLSASQLTDGEKKELDEMCQSLGLNKFASWELQHGVVDLFPEGSYHEEENNNDDNNNNDDADAAAAAAAATAAKKADYFKSSAYVSFAVTDYCCGNRGVGKTPPPLLDAYEFIDRAREILRAHKTPMLDAKLPEPSTADASFFECCQLWYKFAAAHDDLRKTALRAMLEESFSTSDGCQDFFISFLPRPPEERRTSGQAR